MPDGTVMRTLMKLAVASVEDCRRRGVQPRYRTIADQALQRYLAADQGAVRFSAEEHTRYAHEIVRQLLEREGGRRL